jgi:hypothetical protein
MTERTLVEDLRHWSAVDEAKAQGGGHSVLLAEAADRIVQLEEALEYLLRQANDCGAEIDTEGAEVAITQPPRY